MYIITHCTIKQYLLPTKQHYFHRLQLSLVHHHTWQFQLRNCYFWKMPSGMAEKNHWYARIREMTMNQMMLKMMLRHFWITHCLEDWKTLIPVQMKFLVILDISVTTYYLFTALEFGYFCDAKEDVCRIYDYRQSHHTEVSILSD